MVKQDKWPKFKAITGTKQGIKLMEVEVGTEQPKILQLTLKQPATSNFMLMSLLKMPQIQDFMCPITQ